MTAPRCPQVTKNEACNQATMSIVFLSEFEFFLMILVALHNGPRWTIGHNQDTCIYSARNQFPINQMIITTGDSTKLAAKYTFYIT